MSLKMLVLKKQQKQFKIMMFLNKLISSKINKTLHEISHQKKKSQKLARYLPFRNLITNFRD